MSSGPPPITVEKIRVRYGETDQMGHAYYANYLYWMEQARGAWCRDRGFTYKELEELGYKLPVVEVHVRYKGEVKYDDLIEVRIHLAEVRRAALQFRYEIFNLTTEQVCTEGYTWHVLIDGSHSAITVPESVRAWLDRDPAQWETKA
jgi:acyl-CoA thioester hydrolase